MPLYGRSVEKLKAQIYRPLTGFNRIASGSSVFKIFWGGREPRRDVPRLKSTEILYFIFRYTRSAKICPVSKKASSLNTPPQ